MPPKLEDEWLSLAQRFEQFGHGSWVVENGSVTEVLGLLKVVKGCTHGISILSGREALSETSDPGVPRRVPLAVSRMPLKCRSVHRGFLSRLARPTDGTGGFWP
jgi:hypothetical protein